VAFGGPLKSQPHSPQNFFPGGILALQLGHSNSIFAPHCSQNFIPSRFSDWHFGHFIFMPPEGFTQVKG
jgi:hypothetical protein